jgi:hypothetical protein
MKKYIFSISLLLGYLLPTMAQKSWSITPKIGITIPFHIFETRKATPESVIFSGTPSSGNFNQKGILLGTGFERKLGQKSEFKTEVNLLFRENIWMFPLDSNGTIVDYSRAFTLQIPLLLVFQPVKMIHFEVGGMFSQILSHAPYSLVKALGADNGAKNNFVHPSNFDICAGMTYHLGRYVLGVRWTRDLLVFARHHDTFATITDEYRQDMQFTLGYKIGKQ